MTYSILVKQYVFVHCTFITLNEYSTNLKRISDLMDREFTNLAMHKSKWVVRVNPMPPVISCRCDSCEYGVSIQMKYCLNSWLF